MRLLRYSIILLLLIGARCYAQQNLPSLATESSRLLIESIECKGNVTTSCDFIRRKLRLVAATEVESDAVQNAQLRLSALPNFQSVRVYLEKGSAPGKVVLIVEVVEAPTIVTELSAAYLRSSIRYSNPYFRSYDTQNEYLNGRISDQNLFGRQKIAELSVNGIHSGNSSQGAHGIAASAAYIDPNLFGADSWFLSVSAAYSTIDNWAEYRFDIYDPTTGNPTASLLQRNDIDNRTVNGTLSIGYRLWEYSYVIGGFGYSSNRSRTQVTGSPSFSSFESDYSSHLGHWSLGYGWDSEDDAYFPTRGSRFSAMASYNFTGDIYCATCDRIDWSAAYKKTWMAGKASVWSFNIGGEPVAPADRVRPMNIGPSGGLNLRYAHLLSPSDSLGGLRRARWYLQLGSGPIGLRSGGSIVQKPDQAYVALGFRLESKTLGMIELQIAADRRWPR